MGPARAAVVMVVLLVATTGLGLTLDDDGNNLDHCFKDCGRSSRGFDSCVRSGLNTARVFFKTGVPEYGVRPFDPFFAQEVVQKWGGPSFNYKLRLKDVYEHGWTESLVTSFKSDLPARMIKYSQLFPDKFLQGRYELEGKLLGYPLSNKGLFNLTLYNYTQATTIRMPEVGPMSVKVSAQSSANMKIHVSNLLGGRPVMEDLLGRIINFSWPPGFELLKPAIDDLVSSAFSAIFSKDFAQFPFDKVFPA